MAGKKTIILLDGGYVKKRLRSRKGPPTADDVVAYCRSLATRPELDGHEIFRMYFYDAPPFEGKATNPLSGDEIDFSSTPQARSHKALLDGLEQRPFFAVRRGILKLHGWRLGTFAMKSLKGTARPIEPQDLVPDLEQKGVDMRLGLDIAWMALKRVADVLVLVAGDSDLIPAMKLARREGLLVYLDTLGGPVYPELKAHADLMFSKAAPPVAEAI